MDRNAADGLVFGLPANLVQGMLWLAVIGCCTAMAMPVVHLVSHATDLGHPAARAAELLSVMMIAGFISRIGFGMLADRIGAVPTLLIGSAAALLITRDLRRGADVVSSVKVTHRVSSTQADGNDVRIRFRLSADEERVSVEITDVDARRRSP